MRVCVCVCMCCVYVYVCVHVHMYVCERVCMCLYVCALIGNHKILTMSEKGQELFHPNATKGFFRVALRLWSLRANSILKSTPFTDGPEHLLGVLPSTTHGCILIQINEAIRYD